jgi:hypothetical protein
MSVFSLARLNIHMFTKHTNTIWFIKATIQTGSSGVICKAMAMQRSTIHHYSTAD